MKRALGVVLLASLFSQASHAQVVRNVTNLVRTQTTAAAVDAAGDDAFSISDANPYGTNPAHELQIFRWNPITGTGQQVTTIPGGVDVDFYMYGPSVTDDGTKVAFLLDQRLALINADGTGLVQLTATPAAIYHFQIAGNGTRVVFDSPANLVGSNPSGIVQVYVVEANGTNLRQVTSQTSHVYGVAWPSISDDGTRITYIRSQGTIDSNAQIAGVLENGTGFHLITNRSGLHAGFNQLSGNGQSVAIQLDSSTSLPPGGGGCDGGQVALVNWDATGLISLDAPCLGDVVGGYVGAPDITDDAQTIFYARDEFGMEIGRINRDGTNKMPVTDTFAQPGPKATCDAFARVAGSGARVAFTCFGGEPWGGPNTDLSNELYAASGTGVGKLQLSRLLDGDSRNPEITPDGSLAVFSSTARPDGGTGFALEQLFKTSLGGNVVSAITSFASGAATEPSVTDAGDVVAFVHDDEVFAIDADGTDLHQLTPVSSVSPPSVEGPRIAGNGSWVVFRSTRDLLAEGGITGSPIYRVHPDGTGLARMTSKTAFTSLPRIDATGAWMVASVGGTVRRVKTDGTADQAIGSGTTSGYPDVTPGGGTVVYDSSANPVGTNADGSLEIFLWTESTGLTRQLTSSPSGVNRSPTISRDGSWVYFWSDAPRYGWEVPDSPQPYRVNAATSTVERVGGLIGCSQDAYEFEPLRPPSVSMTGTLAVFGTRGVCTEANNDRSGEIWLVDRTAKPKIRVSPGQAPTVVSWDVESGPVFYDVIRGNVASLAPGGGGTVDLGAVTCIASDTPTSSTAPDPTIPLPGQVFFYLYRATPGAVAGPGSYGTGSSGGERVPSSGGCGG